MEAASQSSIPLPREATIAFTHEPDGIHYVADTVYSDGKKVHADAAFRLDGSSYPVIGGLLGDALSARQNGDLLEATITKAGKPTAKASSEVSPDGETMTTEWEVLQPDQPSITYRTIAQRQG
ncbi:MAG: hypothetical protein WB992_22805 [Bryobacteraceae bacterium]